MIRLQKTAPAFLFCWILSVLVGVSGLAQEDERHGRSILLRMTDDWSPFTVDEELEVAGYLRRQTEAYLSKVRQLDPESLKERPEIDEKAAELLQVRIENLRVTLKEMVSTLRLIERTARGKPGEYSQTAPLLWLTVVKDIATEKENARDLERLGFFDSDWSRIVEMVLPRIFSRILEPRITALLRELRR